MSYRDDYKIFLNIMAQSPDGLGDPQLIGKFAKAKAQLHAIDSMNQMQAMNNSPMMANQSPQGTMLPTSNNTATSDGSMPQTPESNPNTPSTPEGGQVLNLPQ